MTHTYAMKRLLEHGPLSWRELVAITGWPVGAVKGAINCLLETETVVAERVGPHRNIYRLAS